MKKKYPHIEIKYGKLLDPVFIAWSKEKYPEWEPAPPQEVIEKVAVFRDAWEKDERKILDGITDGTGLKYVRDWFDVYVVNGTPRDMSDPIVIKSRYGPDEFVDVLVHELLHRLLVLNKVKVGKVYNTESSGVINHIYVYAIMEYLYLDIFKDTQRLERNVKKAEGNKDYKRAWEIVGEEGYTILLQTLKNSLV